MSGNNKGPWMVYSACFLRLFRRPKVSLLSDHGLQCKDALFESKDVNVVLHIWTNFIFMTLWASMLVQLVSSV